MSTIPEAVQPPNLMLSLAVALNGFNVSLARSHRDPYTGIRSAMIGVRLYPAGLFEC